MKRRRRGKAAALRITESTLSAKDIAAIESAYGEFLQGWRATINHKPSASSSATGNSWASLTSNPTIWDSINQRPRARTGRFWVKSLAEHFTTTPRDAEGSAYSDIIQNIDHAITAHKALLKTATGRREAKIKLAQLKANKCLFKAEHERQVAAFLKQLLDGILKNQNIPANIETVTKALSGPGTRYHYLCLHAKYKALIVKHITNDPKQRKLALSLLGKIIDYHHDQAEQSNLYDCITNFIEFWTPIASFLCATVATILTLAVTHPSAPLLLAITCLAYGSLLGYASLFTSIMGILRNAWHGRWAPRDYVVDIWLNIVSFCLGFLPGFVNIFFKNNRWMARLSLKFALFAYSLSSLINTYKSWVHYHFYRDEEFYAKRIFSDYREYLTTLPGLKPSTIYHYQILFNHNTTGLKQYLGLLRDYSRPYKRLIHPNRHFHKLNLALIQIIENPTISDTNKHHRAARTIHQLFIKGQDTTLQSKLNTLHLTLTAYQNNFNAYGSYARRLRFLLFCHDKDPTKSDVSHEESTDPVNTGGFASIRATNSHKQSNAPTQHNGQDGQSKLALEASSILRMLYENEELSMEQGKAGFGDDNLANEPDLDDNRDIKNTRSSTVVLDNPSAAMDDTHTTPRDDSSALEKTYSQTPV